MLETIVAKGCSFQSRHVPTIPFEFFLYIGDKRDLRRFSYFLDVSPHLVEREYAFVVTEVAFQRLSTLSSVVNKTV